MYHMKEDHSRRNRRLFWIAPVALLLVAGIPFALARPARGKQEKTELQQHMGKNQRAFLRIRKWSKDSEKNAKTLEQVLTLQQEFLHAKSLVPKRAYALEGEEKKKFILAYRKGIIKVIGLTLKLETQLLDDDNKAAQETVKEMMEHQRRSHGQFKEED